MNAFDWLGNMSLPGVDMFEVVEVRFKGGRKEFFRNSNRLFLNTGEAIVIEMQSGHHVGHVSLQGELVRIQMRKRKVSENSELPVIYRVATDKDLERYEEVKKREMPTMFRARQIIDELKLNMKLSDVEYQADNTKATFYYSADERVDFRELIKLLAGEFKIRVEMRQISLRQEAGRVGGIGSCGRELCCSTWLNDFRSVSTSAARYQNLSLNPSKLSGQCGRLKCCLNYELETYQDALIDIPEVKEPLKTKQGLANLQKVDIFKKLLWFSVEGESNWMPVEAERVSMILELNKQGRVPEMVMSEGMLVSEEYQNLTNNDVRRSSSRMGSKSKGRASESSRREPIKEDAPVIEESKDANRRKKRRKKSKVANNNPEANTMQEGNSNRRSGDAPKHKSRRGGGARGNAQNRNNQQKSTVKDPSDKPKAEQPKVDKPSDGKTERPARNNSNRNNRRRSRGKAKPFNNKDADNGVGNKEA